MASIEARLNDLDLELPMPFSIPESMKNSFCAVSVIGNRCVISGHVPLAMDGALAGPFGKVGSDVSLEEAVQAARLTALSMLASLKAELGSLDHIVRWSRVLAMVSSAPDFYLQSQVVNGFSDIIVSVFGSDIGRHTRSAIGVAALPFNVPVEVEAEILIA